MTAIQIVHLFVLALNAQGEERILQDPETYKSMAACEAQIEELKQRSAVQPIVIEGEDGNKYVIVAALCKPVGNPA